MSPSIQNLKRKATIYVLMHLKTIHILLKLFNFCKCQCILKMFLTSIHLFLLLKTLFLHMFVIFINEFCTINLSDGHLLGAQNCNGNESIESINFLVTFTIFIC